MISDLRPPQRGWYVTMPAAMCGLALVLSSLLVAQAGEATRNTGGPRLGSAHGTTSRGCVARRDGWLSITAVVDNPGPTSTNAVLEAWPTDVGGDAALPRESVRFQRQLRLPPRSQRAVPLLVHVGDPTGDLEIRLTAADQPSSRARLNLSSSLAAATARQQAGSHVLPMLLVSQRFDQSILSSLLRTAAPVTLGPQQLRIHEARLEGLPHHPLGYHPFDVVVVDQVSPDELGRSKLEALAAWVATGGHLVVVFSGTPGAWRGTPLEPTLPIRIERTLSLRPRMKLLDLPDTGRLLTVGSTAKSRPGPSSDTIVGVGTMHPDAAAWWRAVAPAGSTLGEPLLASRAYGGGTVSMLTFSIPRSSGKSTSIARGLTHLITRIGRQREGNTDVLSNLAREFTVRIPEVRPPPVAGIGVMLILYTLLLGPIAWLVLRNLGRREWSLGTGPALAIAFCVALNQVSLCYRGSVPLRTRFTIVHARATTGTDAEPSGKVVEHTGYFVPQKGRYSGSTRPSTSPPPAFPAAVNLADRRISGLGRRSASARVDESRDSFDLDDLLVEASTGRLLMVHGPLTNSPISCQLRLASAKATSSSPRLVGHIQAGPHDLPNTALVIGNRFLSLPALAAGERQEDWSSPSSWRPGRIPTSIYGHLQQYRSSTAPSMFPWQETSPLSTALAESLAPRACRPGHLPATFVCQLAPPEPLTSLVFSPPGKRRASGGLALVSAEIPLPRGDQVHIPPGLLTTRLAAASEDSRDLFTNSTSRLIEVAEDSSVIYEYTVPLLTTLGDTVDQLDLRCLVNDSQLKLRVETFDFAAGRFWLLGTRNPSTTTSLISRQIPSELAPDLVHPMLGLVWIRLSVSASNSPSFLAQPLLIETLELGVTGTRR